MMIQTLQTFDLKNGLLNECIHLQQELVTAIKESMKHAIESANMEPSAEDNADSFREQCNMDRDMYSMKLREATLTLAGLQKINGAIESDTVRYGAVVMTDVQNLFVSVSLGQVKFEGDTFVAISIQSPLYQVMEGKKKGDSFEFRGRTFKINEIH
jgi:predicted aspartyl protease